MYKFKNIFHRAAAAVLTAGLFASCADSFVYDDEGDCDPHYRVNFVYDHNLKFADAFAAEVDHVSLNVIDADGRIVLTHTESGPALAADGYEVNLDGLAPGKYRLQAWCGMGAHADSKSFAVHPAQSLADLRCTLLPDEGAAAKAAVGGAEGTDVRRRLRNLYHGITDQQLFIDDEGTHRFTVPLKKNTNSVKVVLQHLSGDPVDYNDFDFTITAANARMDFDNSIIAAAPVTYHAWDVRGGQASIAPGGDDADTHRSAVAEFTVGRLMADENVRLEARRKSDGKLAFSVNMVDLALLVKSANLASMPAQEFLDRQDDYNFIFFLDSNLRWTQVQINILSWVLVVNNTEV